MTVIVRRFIEDDRKALREIYLESRLATFHWLDGSLFAAEDFDRGTEGESIWVALRDEVPVGFIAAWEPENFIHHLYVHPNEVGQGIGTLLLDACLDSIGRPAALKCLSRNRPARDFYLTKGWKVISEGKGTSGKFLLMHLD